MKQTMLWLTAVSALLMSACTRAGYEKSKSGLEYKIFSDGKGKQLKQGDFVKFNYRISYNDSLITESFSFIPGYDQVDSVGRFHDFSEILPKMREGDSAVVFQLVDTMQTRNEYGLPPYMKKGGRQKMVLKILKVIDGGREVAVTDYRMEMDKYKDKEMAVIEKYLIQKNISAQKVNNTVFVEVLSKGSGTAADSGKLVGVKYTGYNFQGEFFDSNIDSTKQKNRHSMEPFYFVAQQEGAIAGMLEGITVFNQGGKGRLYVPSIAAYGPQGNPPDIKPNENLIFDIEVVEVKDMPAQPAGPVGINPPTKPGN